MYAADETKVDPTYQIPIAEEDRRDNGNALEFLIKGGSNQQFKNEVVSVMNRKNKIC